MFVSRTIALESDTLTLEQVLIYPWRTFAEFRDAFMNLELPEDKEIENARKNIALILTQIEMMKYEPMPTDNYKLFMNNIFQKNAYYGQYPAMNILSPLSWAQFIQAIQNGAFDRRRKQND